jgi:hypothetical protein
MTYIEYICEEIRQTKPGEPIYSKHLSDKVKDAFNLDYKNASAAVAVALKRIIENAIISDLKIYQKGIYYRTVKTAFGEMGINKSRLITDKYLADNKGYETGPAILHRLGLTSQMPKQLLVATNVAKECMRVDNKLGVIIKVPKVKITAENKAYLQILDVLDMMDNTPIDEIEPHYVVANHIKKLNLRYDTLLALADKYYNQKTILQLARTASVGA